jgi:Zn finger protein HypA/HybF involved in hydrogenase expression
VHELSLALEICAVLERQLPPHQLPQLVAIGLDVGEDANIEMANLQFCLDTLLTHPPFAGATVEVTAVPGEELRIGYLDVDDERPMPLDAAGPTLAVRT